MLCKCMTAQLVGTVFHPRFNRTLWEVTFNGNWLFFSCRVRHSRGFTYGMLYVIFQSVTVCSHIGQGSGACQLPLTWNPELSLMVEAITTRCHLQVNLAQLIWSTDSLIGFVRMAQRRGLALHSDIFCQKPGSNVIGLHWEIHLV